MPSKYCVISHLHEYQIQRYLLTFGSVFVILFTILGCPLFFAEVYQQVERKCYNARGSEYWRFLTWSVVITSFIVNALVLANNFYVLMSFYQQYETTSKESLLCLVMFSVIGNGVWIVNFLSGVGVLAYLKWKKMSSRDPSSPEDNITGNDSCSSMWLHICGIALGYAIIVHFLQLISFHVVYVILGAIASPTETLSVVCNYVAGYLFAVTYIAVVLKYVKKKRFLDRNVTLSCCIFPLCIAGLSLIISMTCYTAFFYLTDSMNQNSGMLGIVKSFLPSLFVMFLGFLGHKVLIYIDNSEQVENSSLKSTDETLQNNGSPDGSSQDKSLEQKNSLDVQEPTNSDTDTLIHDEKDSKKN